MSSQDLANAIGSDLAAELDEVIKIRTERRKCYGDDYKDADLCMLYTLMRMKLHRYFQQLVPGVSGVRDEFTATVRDEGKPVARDSLRDLVNFALFTLAKLRSEP
jgi:hypothetical protein